MAKKYFFSKKQIEYIESVVYILAIILVIFCKVYGNIYFSLIPLLVILGIVGKIFFNRSIVTTVFGILVSLCMVYTKGNMSILENILYSFFVGLDIAMGELLGEYLKKSIKIFKKSKEKGKRSYKKDLKIYAISFVIFIVTVLVNSYTNGNVISYEKCKNSLNNYLKDNYNEKNFEVISVSYAVGINPNYVFHVFNEDENYISKFTVYIENTDIVKDEYKETLFTKNNTIKNVELKKYLELNNYLQKYNDIEITLNYIDIENIEIALTKKVNILDEEQKEIFAKQVVEFLEDIKGYKDYEKIEDLLICIASKNNEKDVALSNIFLEGYNKNIVKSDEEPYRYILKSLSIEYIDSK